MGPDVSGQTNKSTLLITPNYERKGVLINILHTFAELDINLTWIESRPTKTKLGTYRFYLDIDAGIADDRLHKALAILGIHGHKVRILGAYSGHQFENRLT